MSSISVDRDLCKLIDASLADAEVPSIFAGKKENFEHMVSRSA